MEYTGINSDGGYCHCFMLVKVNIMRFKYYPIPQIITDTRTGKRYYSNKAVCDLLNELNEENLFLKGKVANCRKILLYLQETARRLQK